MLKIILLNISSNGGSNTNKRKSTTPNRSRYQIAPDLKNHQTNIKNSPATIKANNNWSNPINIGKCYEK